MSKTITSEIRPIMTSLHSLDGQQLHYYKTSKIDNLIKIIYNVNINTSDVNLFDTMYEMEALYSSEVEGYFTTRRELSKFINKEREPKTKDEKAVFGNYMALQHGIYNVEKLYTKDFILELNSLITGEYVDDYRTEPVVISNKKGDIVHEGLPFDLLDAYMNNLLLFAETNNLEPLIASCILHFDLVYIHAFLDGNGRTARAYAYSYLIHSGLNKFKLFSVSYMLPTKRKQYYAELLRVENNGYNLTNFIEFMLEVILEGLRNIRDIQNQVLVIKEAERLFKSNEIPFSNMTENILKFILTKDNFTVENFYKKNRSKYRRLGLTDTEIKEDINVVLNRLINLNIITKDFKISEEYDNDKM